jgi:hypothetical protein
MQHDEEARERLRDLMAKATDGPWVARAVPDNDSEWEIIKDDPSQTWNEPNDRCWYIATVMDDADGVPSQANAELIVAAVNTLRTLLAELDELAKEVAALTEGWESAQAEWQRVRAAYYAFCGDLGCSSAQEVADRLLAAEAKASGLVEAAKATARLPLADGSEGILSTEGVLLDYDSAIIRARQALAALSPADPSNTASVTCETCGGRGEIGGWVGQTAESGGYETEACPDCNTASVSASPAADQVERLLRTMFDWGVYCQTHRSFAICTPDGQESAVDNLVAKAMAKLGYRPSAARQSLSKLAARAHIDVPSRETVGRSSGGRSAPARIIDRTAPTGPVEGERS